MPDCRLAACRVGGAGLHPRITRYMLEQRWGRVQEAISERRELLGWLRTLPLDAEGRRCLLALTRRRDRVGSAIAAMMGESRLAT